MKRRALPDDARNWRPQSTPPPKPINKLGLMRWSASTCSIYEDRVQRRGGTDEKPVALGATEAHIGDHLRNTYLADQYAIGRIAMNPIAGAGPQIALRIDAETVEQVY